MSAARTASMTESIARGPGAPKRRSRTGVARELVIDGHRIAPGERTNIQLRVARLKTQTEVGMPLCVVHGQRPGPTLFVSAAIHGDELNGTEIVRRLLRLQRLDRLRGTLLAVPMVNVFGFIGLSRYLPDRRDLNRSFPGSEKGSLAARLADLFMREVVARSTHGIDLHTGTIHRTNLPQVRAALDDEPTLELARSFGAPVIIDASTRDGSLREAACDRGIPVILYEAGEALRFDEWAIRPGLRGIVSVMESLGMLPGRKRRPFESLQVERSTWVRAPESGILHARATLGQRVRPGDVLGTVGDPFGNVETPVEAPATGIVIGRTNLPVLNEGDAVFHVARTEESEPIPGYVEAFQAHRSRDRSFDPEELIE